MSRIVWYKENVSNPNIVIVKTVINRLDMLFVTINGSRWKFSSGYCDIEIANTGEYTLFDAKERVLPKVMEIVMCKETNPENLLNVLIGEFGKRLILIEIHSTR